MRPAIDFSYARPTPDEVAAHGFDILVYTGPARPDKAYLDAMRAKGVAVTLVQESDPNRSQQGHAAGVADAQYADSRADEVGHALSSSIAYVVSDGSAGDPNSGADNIVAYAAGVQSVSRRPFFFYGNQYATDAALRGAPKALGSWIPSTWGSGSLMTQEANAASPIADTDLNTVHADYTGAPAPAPAPRKTGQKMQLLVGPAPVGVLSVLVDPAGDEVARRAGPVVGYGLPEWGGQLPTDVDVHFFVAGEVYDKTLKNLEARKK